MGYKQNNPLPMMKSAMKMHKAEKKAGMHRDSAMYMNSPMEKGHSPMEMGHSPMEMGHSPMEMGHESPANKESRELKDMPIVDIEKGDAKGDGRINARKKQPKSEREYGSPAKAAKPDYFDNDGDGDKSESMKEAAKDKKGSPAKKYDKVVFGGNKGDKSKTKPGKKDFEKKGSPASKIRGSKGKKAEKSSEQGFDRVVLGGNKGDKSKTKPGKKDYEGSPANMGHKDSPAELSWEDIKKAGRTMGQLGKDIAYQVQDMFVPDESRGIDMNWGTAGGSKVKSTKAKEKKNYDISRDRAARGETFFSAADLFDDSGKGNILGTDEASQRKDKGALTPTGDARKDRINYNRVYRNK